MGRKVSSFQSAGVTVEAIAGELRVVAAAEGSELLPGDVIVLANGEMPLSADELERLLRRRPDSDLQVLRETGDGEELVSALHRLPRLSPDWAYVALALAGIAYLLIGLYTLSRQRNRQTLLFHLWALTSAALYLVTPIAPFDAIDRLFYLVDGTCRLLLPPLTLHFFLVFPARPNSIRARRSVPWLYLPAAALVTLQLDRIFGAGRLAGDLSAAALERQDRVELLLLAAYALAAAAVLSRRLLSRRNWEQGRQTQWIAFGVAGGYLPFLVLYVVPYALEIPAPGWLDAVAVAPLALVPLSFAYALLRYRLWDVAVVARDVATYTLTVLLAILGFSLLSLLISRTVPSDLTVARGFLNASALLVVGAVAIPVRQGIGSSLLRLQYRTQRSRRALERLGEELLHERDLERLASNLLHALEEGLSLERSNLFLVEGDRLAPVREEGEEAVPALARGEDARRTESGQAPARQGAAVLRIGADASAEQRRRTGSLAEANAARPDHGLPGLAEIDDAWSEPCRILSRAPLADAGDRGHVRLAALGYHCVFPLTVRERKVGLLCVGRRVGGAPLSSDDLSLIRQLLNQAALALENAQLLEQRRRQLARVSELRQFSEEIIESSPAGIAVVDETDRIVTANGAFAALLGLTRSTVADRMLGDLVPRRLFPRLDDPPAEVRFEDLNGNEKYLQLSVAAFQGAAAGHRIVVAHDVTERVAMKRELAEKERLAALGAMAAGVAHEVNTPLTGISSYAQMLLAETSDRDPRRRLLRKVERQTFRASRIVNTLLDFARCGRHEPAPVDLAAVVKDSCDALADRLAEAGVEIRIDLGSGAALRAPGNGTELGQVLANLMMNAIDAMTEAGCEKRRLSLTARNSGSTIDVFVDDTGPGIPEPHLERVFEPFFSTRKAAGGTGLGLSISQDIVRRHGGELSASNLSSGGCRLTLRLPTMPRPQPQSKENDA